MTDSDEEFIARVVEVLRQELVPFTEAAERCGAKPERVWNLRARPEVRERLDEARRECLDRMKREIREGTLPRKMGLLAQSRRPYADRPQLTDPEVERRLRDLWADRSLTRAQIAADLGVSVATMQSWKDALGLPHRPTGRPARKPKS